MSDIDQWKHRYTVREFDSSKIPSAEQITHITQCLNYMPIQATSPRQQLPNHFIFLLTPEDNEIKKFLVENIFHSPEKNEYFTALYDAPYVFLLVDILRKVNKKYFSPTPTSVFFTSLGLSTGVILSQAIDVGLDVCQIACIENLDNKKKTTQ